MIQIRNSEGFHPVAYPPGIVVPGDRSSPRKAEIHAVFEHTSFRARILITLGAHDNPRLGFL